MEEVYERIKGAQRIVIKIGTSTLTYENGKVNIRQFDSIARVVTDIKNSGREVIVVSSGAGGVAMGKLGYSEKPKDMGAKQAFAAVGQCELMYMYDKMFSDYNSAVAQILLTKDDIDEPKRLANTRNTLDALLRMHIIPIINENDTVKMVSDLDNINCDIGGAGSNRGTGGMISKINAGKIAASAGIDMIITNGKNIASLYDILEGKPVGTVFAAGK